MKRGFSLVLLIHKINCWQPNLMWDPWVNRAVPSQPLLGALEFGPVAGDVLLSDELLVKHPQGGPYRMDNWWNHLMNDYFREYNGRTWFWSLNRPSELLDDFSGEKLRRSISSAPWNKLLGFSLLPMILSLTSSASSLESSKRFIEDGILLLQQ